MVQIQQTLIPCRLESNQVPASMYCTGTVCLDRRGNWLTYCTPIGRFETPSYESLCSRWMEAEVSVSVDAESCEDGQGLSFDHIIGDAKSLHRDPTNTGAVFQVASQFNALEMVTDLVHLLCCR